MGTKMKGLLKGLRYISQIFDIDTKEPEMQIGYPTDVKHVAHVGWEGPSVNAPSLMDETVPATVPVAGGSPPKFPPEIGGAQYSTARDPSEFPAQRSSRRNQSSGADAVDSPVRESSEGLRHSRRNRGTAGHREEGTAGSGGGGGSESQDGGAGVPKRDRPRRKTKGSSSGGGSVRSTSRSNAVASESDGAVESQRSNSDTIEPQEVKRGQMRL